MGINSNCGSYVTFQVEDWLMKCDVDHDGVVSYEEFKFSLAGNMMIDL